VRKRAFVDQNSKFHGSGLLKISAQRGVIVYWWGCEHSTQQKMAL